MKRRLISVCVAAALTLGLTGMSWAVPFGQIWYGGYVHKYLSPTGGLPLVQADTAIVVFNSTGAKLWAMINVYDKYGTRVKRSVFIDGGVLANPIPPDGWGWITLGMLVPPAPIEQEPATKYTFRIDFGALEWPAIAPVVELKEVIYLEPQTLDEDPPYTSPFWSPGTIRIWSETSLGGDNGTGFHWLPLPAAPIGE